MSKIRIGRVTEIARGTVGTPMRLNLEKLFGMSPSRDIIKIVGALDFKRNVIASFHEGEIAPGIGDFRQVDDAAGI
jgi:hypothetical protein